MRIRISVLLALVLLAPTLAPGLTPNTPPRKYKRIQKYLDQAAPSQLAGVIVYIHTPKAGEWVGTAGLADLRDKTPMTKDNILALASVGKMYNAVAVMKLVEQGKLGLDDRIAAYLPADLIDHLPNGRDVTIRHLMGHTSGFPNYDTDPELNQRYLTGQLKLDTLSHEEVLRQFIFDKPSLNPPGTAYHYSSTNYMLLAMIVDKISPEGHADYLRKLIRQFGFVNTSYRQSPADHNVQYYGDLNKDGALEDLTDKTHETTQWFIGDDGVYAPIVEAAHFLQALMKGKIIGDQALAEMKTGNTVAVDTGLGLTTDRSFPYGLLYGHGGRGIGITADVYYFPKQDITIAILCNTGIRTATPALKKAYLKMRSRIVKKIFLF